MLLSSVAGITQQKVCVEVEAQNIVTFVEEVSDNYIMNYEDIAWTVAFATIVTVAVIGNTLVLWIVLGRMTYL